MRDYIVIDNSSLQKELQDENIDLFDIPSMPIHDLVLVINIFRSKWIQRISFATDSSFRIHTQEKPNEQDIHIIRQFVEHLMNSPVIIKRSETFIDFSKI